MKCKFILSDGMKILSENPMESTKKKILQLIIVFSKNNGIPELYAKTQLLYLYARNKQSGIKIGEAILIIISLLFLTIIIAKNKQKY